MIATSKGKLRQPASRQRKIVARRPRTCIRQFAPTAWVGLGATLGSQLGQPGSLLIDVPVRHVECSAIGLADLTDWTQFNWTCAAIKAELKQVAAAAAAAMARTASSFIEDPSPDQLAAFVEVFGSQPESLVPGTRFIIGKADQGEVRWRLQAARFRRAAVLARACRRARADRSRVTGSATSSRRKQGSCGSRLVAVISLNRSAINGHPTYSRRRCWRRMASGSNGRRQHRRLNNVFCYLKFVYRAWGGLEAPLWVLDHCSVSV